MLTEYYIPTFLTANLSFWQGSAGALLEFQARSAAEAILALKSHRATFSRNLAGISGSTAEIACQGDKWRDWDSIESPQPSSSCPSTCHFGARARRSFINDLGIIQ